MGEETDKVAEHEATPVPAAAPRDEAARRQWTPARERALLIAAVAVAAVVAGLGTAAYRAATATRDDLGRLEARIAATLAQQRELQAAVDTTQARTEAVRREVDQKVAEQERSLQTQRQGMAQQQIRLDEERERARQQAADLNESVAALHRRLGRDSARWMVAEAEYLIQVAQQRLTLAQDPLTALEALRLADRRLQETGDPGWIGVRELLAEETAALASLRAPDVPAIAAQLAALAEQAAALQPRNAASPAAIAPASPGDDGAWRRVLRDGWEGFRSLVVVRRHDNPAAAMLSPDQAYFLGQTLRLQIDTARLALLRADPASYRGSLDAARQLLATYFDPTDPSSAAVSAALERLAGVDLRPPMPDVTRSLRALRARDRQTAELQDRKGP
jgi:uroporphyrin-3 C-methyltransferase